MEQMQTIRDELPAEIARVTTLIETARKGGPAGALAARRLEQVVNRAEHAQASGDVVAMYNAYQELLGCA